MYQNNLENLPKEHPFRTISSKFGMDYFKTPTEVFARGFEMYIEKHENVKSAFVKDTSNFNRTEYKAFDGCEQLLDDYFKKQFPEMELALQNFKPLQMELSEIVVVEEKIKEYDSLENKPIKKKQQLALQF